MSARRLGKAHCQVEHVGMVVSGCATAAMADGRVIEMRAGELFYMPPGRRATTAGWSATSPMSRCTSSAPTITPRRLAAVSMTLILWKAPWV